MMGKSAAMLVSLGWLIEIGWVFAGQPIQISPTDFGRDLGLFAASADGKFCLSINNDALKPGHEIVLIWVAVEGERDKPEIRRGKIAAKLAAPCDDANQANNETSYRLESGKLDNGRIYIAIAARPSNVRVIGSEVRARLGKHDLSFRSCTSTEGLHFSAWSGTPPKDQPVWQRYFYFGYDVEPTCVERDFKEIKP